VLLALLTRSCSFESAEARQTSEQHNVHQRTISAHGLESAKIHLEDREGLRSGR
jgi:hypothetical protein